MSTECMGIALSLAEEQVASVARVCLKNGLESAVVASIDALLSRDDLDRCGFVAAPLPQSSADVRLLLQVITDRQSPLRVIWFAAHADVSTIVEAIRQGASDVLPLPLNETTFQTAVSNACRESAEQRARIAARAVAREKLSRLSTGEREVLELMLAGKVNKSVASRLAIALRTVENRRKQIFTKLGTRSLAEIVSLVRAVQGPASDEANFRTLPTPPNEPRGWDRAAG